MVETLYLNENKPYPNNSLPVLYYQNILEDVFPQGYNADDVMELFENNGYMNSWTGIIKDQHHFHSNAHEVLAITHGEVTVLLGGENGEIMKVRNGDVLLLPAGVSHKRIDATENFEVVGAYPANCSEYDFQYGDASDYEAIKETIQQVPLPETDPVTGSPGEVQKQWH